MTSDIIEPPPSVEDEDPAVIIAWLNSEESDEWRRSLHRQAFFLGSAPAPSPHKDPGPVNAVWDPCGRPPGVGVENAAREAG